MFEFHGVLLKFLEGLDQVESLSFDWIVAGVVPISVFREKT
jgi:hypothetical protein